MNIQDLITEAHQTAVEHGWWEEREGAQRNFAEQIALMHSELSEALEEWRKQHFEMNLYYDGLKPEGIAAELADVLIRIADTCGRYDIPLEEALVAKLAYNRTRPYRHGGKHA